MACADGRDALKKFIQLGVIHKSVRGTANSDMKRSPLGDKAVLFFSADAKAGHPTALPVTGYMHTG